MRTITRNYSMKEGDTLKLALTLYNMPTPAEAVEVSIGGLCDSTKTIKLNIENGGVIPVEGRKDVFIIFLSETQSKAMPVGGYLYDIHIKYGAEYGTPVEGQITVGER